MSPADRDVQGAVDTDPALPVLESEPESSPEALTHEGHDGSSVEPVVRIDEARRRSLRRWAIAGAAAIAIAVLGMSLTATPLFHAKAIRIEGERRLSERQVQRAAGVDDATNVFALDEEAVSRRLERSPWIADADVVVSLPSTVTIRVRERIPVAIARTEDGTVLAAADGSILGPAVGAALPEILAAEVAGQTPTPVSAATGGSRGGRGGGVRTRHPVPDPGDRRPARRDPHPRVGGRCDGRLRLGERARGQGRCAGGDPSLCGTGTEGPALGRPPRPRCTHRSLRRGSRRHRRLDHLAIGPSTGRRRCR